jgi:hypothetical protein
MIVVEMTDLQLVVSEICGWWNLSIFWGGSRSAASRP